MNPCPCGRLGSKTRRCICSDTAIQSYHRRLSQPILERIDIHVELEEVPIRQMTEPTVESTEDTMPALRDKIRCVRAQQMERQGTLNSLLDGSVLLSTSQSAPAALTMIEQASLRSVLSARSTVRVLRTARTIADLANSARIEPVHLAEALAYRVLDKRHAGTMEG